MISSICTVDSLDTPDLEPYRTLRRPWSHRERGLFIAEGNIVAQRFLESPLQAISMLVTPEWFARCRALIEKRPEPMRVFIADPKLLETIVGFRCHQGIMALGTVPQSLTLEVVLEKTPAPRLLVAVDHLASAENTGVLVRNCAACGVGALIVGETSADPYLRRAVRNSMGAVFHLPIVYASDLAATLTDLGKRHGFRVMAAHPRPGSAKLQDADFADDCCIVFGHESEGISEKVLQACGRSITIPMAPGIDSFNVACACAVILYEATRQREKGKK